ncbi:MAG: SDR family oxidoreductase [Chitinophagales bacterium]|nr:SDR family oxidoreductase [Chitinophagales bacterium]
MYENKYHEIDIENKNFLITGGAGFIGSHIVAYLMKHNAGKVRVLDNLITGNYMNIQQWESHPNFEFIEGDITDTATCLHACAGIDYLSHQAALGSVPRSIKDPVRSNAINVDGFLNMMIAAKESKIKKVVYASSSSVYGSEASLPKFEDKIGDPLSPYAVTKYTNELYAKVFGTTYNMKIIGLRYFNVFGPRQDPNGPYAAVIPIFIDKLKSKTPVYIDGDGEQTRDFTFVENAVQANIRAMLTSNEEASNQVYNIAFGENYSVNYLYNSIRESLGSTQDAIHRASREGDVRNSLADISKARKLLGYQPLFSFKDGLPITIESYLKAGASDI